ncbi:hypothetical protein L208DRAFT_166358 [Tricholoma matsutake]|nr:hypothetical protein L208DRAFT_166358 [Tricholoma matsutake 945]
MRRWRGRQEGGGWRGRQEGGGWRGRREGGGWRGRRGTHRGHHATAMSICLWGGSWGLREGDSTPTPEPHCCELCS